MRARASDSVLWLLIGLALLALVALARPAQAQYDRPVPLQRTTWMYQSTDGETAIVITLRPDGTAFAAFVKRRETITGRDIDLKESAGFQGVWYVADDVSLCVKARTEAAEPICYDGKLSDDRTLLRWGDLLFRKQDYTAFLPKHTAPTRPTTTTDGPNA